MHGTRETDVTTNAFSNVTFLPTARAVHSGELGRTAIRALTAVLNARDTYTANHSHRVGELSLELARELGLSARHIQRIGDLGKLHDIGKLAVPEAILLKDGPLTDSECATLRAHPEMGQRLVASIPSLAHLAGLIRSAHERWDGSGYPDGLAGEDIPTPSRIVSVCDAYDAMTSGRPYRRALSAREALDELARNAGSQFWPLAVEAFSALAARPLAA